MHAEYQDTQARALIADLLDEIHAAAARHRNVEQQHVELEIPHALDRFQPIPKPERF
jgi:hypothetical protein